MAKSWSEKYNDPKQPEVKILDKDMIGMKKGQRMVLPTPKSIAAALADLPTGQHVDIRDFRDRFALAHKADVACPIVTSIALRTVAEYEHERHMAGVPLSQTVPVWRVVNENSKIAKKLSFDPAFLTLELERETD